MEFRLCQEFGWTPEQIEQMDVNKLALFVGFLNLQAKAENLNHQRQKQKRK